MFLTKQPLPSGANKYHIEVIGQEAWAGEKISFDFVSDAQATNLQQDELIIKKIAIGLAPFIAKTTLANDIELKINKVQESKTTPTPAPTFLNNFIYDLGFNMSFSGDANQNNLKLGGTVELNNVSLNGALELIPPLTTKKKILIPLTKKSLQSSAIKILHWA